MAKNRTIPYGYKIENGRLNAEPQEEKVVVQIFQRYAEGVSYKKIVEWLTQSGIRYMPNKPTWNKNMVARILQNENYLGNEKYPAIVQIELHQKAKEQIKPYTRTESENIKLLKSILACSECGEKLGRRIKATGVERWYCPNDAGHIGLKISDESLLQNIMALQEKLACQSKSQEENEPNGETINPEVIKLSNQIELDMKEPEPNIEEIRKNIMALATEKYNALVNLTNHGNELHHITKELNAKNLNSNLLKEIASQISVSHTQAYELILKNRQKITI